MTTLQYRSIFISDVHLGTRHSKAEYLLDFLRTTESEYLYLVGDIFDIWQMQKRVHWTDAQNAVLNEIFRKANSGTKVVYIPGNHDAWFRDFAGSSYRGVEVRLNAEHITADNRRFFISHGDEFDTLVRHNKILLLIGDHAYNWLLKLNRVISKLRLLFGKPYWSLSAWLKTRVNNANQYIDKFEAVAAHHANKQGYDGYVCGHIHKSGIRKIDGVLYCNDGDWVEHCSALTEDANGWIQLLHWSDRARIEAQNRGNEIDCNVYPLERPERAA
ncbi:MAG TPA: UDP-2,3-diacylglucosamine hydrolase [Gammaproteobacteria bacterium]|jgi:UDP-2,3-diacylglucosamine pyrophosphatase LpxH|nr:UDP-2,3-diacylglucosamine hydrolase [Gammaproteobacteria bacterium]